MSTKKAIISISVAALGALFLAIGCASPSTPTTGPTTSTASADLPFGTFPHTHKTGGQIWAENCNRCHLARPSSQYSPAQWDVITAHMRVRADLNGEEQRAVYHFLSGT